MNLAQLTVVGTVATDIDTHVLPDGRHRARFRVAATSRLLDARTGRWRDGDTTFLAVVAWRRVADAAAQLRRGARIVVIGQLRQYDCARDGQREVGYELQAQQIALCLPTSAADTSVTGPTAAAGASASR